MQGITFEFAPEGRRSKSRPRYEDDRGPVIASYAWSMASISIGDAPVRVRNDSGRYPQPVALLARLGVSLDHEDPGLGAGPLADAIGWTAQLGVEIGCRGLLVHAETQEARDFYLHLGNHAYLSISRAAAPSSQSSRRGHHAQ